MPTEARLIDIVSAACVSSSACNCVRCENVTQTDSHGQRGCFHVAPLPPPLPELVACSHKSKIPSDKNGRRLRDWVGCMQIVTLSLFSYAVAQNYSWISHWFAGMRERNVRKLRFSSISSRAISTFQLRNANSAPCTQFGLHSEILCLFSIARTKMPRNKSTRKTFNARIPLQALSLLPIVFVVFNCFDEMFARVEWIRCLLFIRVSHSSGWMQIGLSIWWKTFIISSGARK